jgi:cholesterol oxidase
MVTTGGVRWDVVVIGSGFGGAVTAARLAEGGMRVLVVERGPWWGPAAADQPRADGRPLPRGVWGSRKLLRNVRKAPSGGAGHWLINRDGLYEIHAFTSMTVLSGSGVGGGSHVYAGIQRRPDPLFWNAFPPEISDQQMSGYFARVYAMQRPAPNPTPALAERAVSRGLRRSGMTVDKPDLAIDWDACVRCGRCVLGCTHRAKTTLDLTYLPAAMAAGAEIWPLCEVTRIKQWLTGFQVSGIDHRTRTRFTARADRLVLAAGTLNTVRLLYQARDRDRALEAVSPALGCHFSGNADYPIVVKRTGSTEPSSGALVNMTAHSGPADRYYVDADVPLPAPLRRIARRYGLLVGMGTEASRASLTYQGGVLASDAGRHDAPALYDEMDVDVASVLRDSMVRSVGRPARKLMSAHPLGGAVIATNPADGVVDHAGRVFGHPRMYVADGSLLPTAPGVPPSLTIAALAERQAELVLQEG